MINISTPLKIWFFGYHRAILSSKLYTNKLQTYRVIDVYVDMRANSAKFTAFAGWKYVFALKLRIPILFLDQLEM